MSKRNQKATPEATITVPSSKKKGQAVTITTALASIAVAAINEVYNAYIEEGGIADLEGQLEAKRESASETIMRIAKGADDVTHFLAACQHAESVLIADRAKEDGTASTIDQLIPSWRQMKSDIKRAWEKGLDVQGASSAQVLKNNLNSIRAKEKEAEGGNARTPTGGNKAGTPDIADPFKEAINRLILKVNEMNRNGLTDEAVALLNDTVNRADAALAALVGKDEPTAPADVPAGATEANA